MAQLLLHAQEHAAEVDTDGLLPSLPGELEKRGALATDTGSVEGAIELAVCVDHRLRHRLDRGRGGDVSLQGERLATAIVVIQPQHLIARIDPRHEHHQRVVRWERDNASEC